MVRPGYFLSSDEHPAMGCRGGGPRRAGRSPLGLVCVASVRPHDLGRNHQVLAYAHQTGATHTVLRVYDPNWPDRDDITLACDLRGSAAHPFACSSGDHTVRGFFLSEYAPADPAALFETAAS